MLEDWLFDHTFGPLRLRKSRVTERRMRGKFIEYAQEAKMGLEAAKFKGRWCAWRELNPQPAASEAVTLSS
jgi:hypothetical protein